MRPDKRHRHFAAVRAYKSLHIHPRRSFHTSNGFDENYYTIFTLLTITSSSDASMLVLALWCAEGNSEFSPRKHSRNVESASLFFSSLLVNYEMIHCTTCFSSSFLKQKKNRFFIFFSHMASNLNTRASQQAHNSAEIISGNASRLASRSIRRQMDQLEKISGH